MADLVAEFYDWLGVKQEVPFEEMTSDEKEVYYKMLDIREQSELSLPDFELLVRKTKNAVEDKLSELIGKTDHESEMRRLYLLARLANLRIFEAYFDRPSEAKRFIVKQIGKRSNV